MPTVIPFLPKVSPFMPQVIRLCPKWAHLCPKWTHYVCPKWAHFMPQVSPNLCPKWAPRRVTTSLTWKQRHLRLEASNFFQTAIERQTVFSNCGWCFLRCCDVVSARQFVSCLSCALDTLARMLGMPQLWLWWRNLAETRRLLENLWGPLFWDPQTLYFGQFREHMSRKIALINHIKQPP